MKILETQELTREFPGVVALDSVNFDLEEGEIHALVGENGAGKSTLVKVLAGVYKPTKGKFLFKGKDMHFHSPKDAAEYIGVVHQERELVPHFTGYQNLFLGLEESKGGFLRKKRMMEKARQFMEKYHLSVDFSLPANELGSAQQEMLTILKVLFRNPGIIIFDEPTAPLNIEESKILFSLIRELKERGMTIVYISHHLSEVLELSDRITVLRNGKVVTTLKNESLDEDKLITLMISKELKNQYPKYETAIGKELLSVSNYTCKRMGLKDVSFRIRAGEIVGFAGLDGSGRTELAQAFFTGAHSEGGSITLNEKPFLSKSPGQSIAEGLIMIPEKRRAEGLLVELSVRENLALSNLSCLSRYGFVMSGKVNEYVNRAISRFSIKVSSPLQRVGTLSGGNQQKVSVGKWMEKDAAIWIFNEPTQGIDVDAKTEIYRIMGDIAGRGAGVWFISSDLRELMAISDRIYVMKGFRIVSEFLPPYADEKILSAMLGGTNNDR
ncbi:MAG TPA: sugar ABC transporter ATP-binding protein [Thermotogota bacterium]|nr:sugar ABC transporter ATP-binding protein [Thermotogota bacterium]HPJ89847.1 sugar ABC transporter ATP-binding protein [Thermotogota bacterium]HPR95920.1 sugar ABC transporter ATP-binding protein [Thermotogota bacterium]